MKLIGADLVLLNLINLINGSAQVDLTQLQFAHLHKVQQ